MSMYDFSQALQSMKADDLADMVDKMQSWDGTVEYPCRELIQFIQDGIENVH